MRTVLPARLSHFGQALRLLGAFGIGLRSSPIHMALVCATIGGRSDDRRLDDLIGSPRSIGPVRTSISWAPRPAACAASHRAAHVVVGGPAAVSRRLKSIISLRGDPRPRSRSISSRLGRIGSIGPRSRRRSRCIRGMPLVRRAAHEVGRLYPQRKVQLDGLLWRTRRRPLARRYQPHSAAARSQHRS